MILYACQKGSRMVGSKCLLQKAGKVGDFPVPGR